MGTYATFCAEVRQEGQWHLNKKDVFPFPEDAWQREKGDDREFWEYPFPSQRYGLFGFFAGIRNYSKTIVLLDPCGLPEDASDETIDLLAPNNPSSDDKSMTVADRVRESEGNYGHSWLSLVTLVNFDYNQTFADQRATPPEVTTYRTFLGEDYFENLDAFKRLGSPEDVRILFCFEG